MSEGKKGKPESPEAVSEAPVASDEGASVEPSVANLREAMVEAATKAEIPTPGRIVHYVTRTGTIRPAMVIGVDEEEATLELVLFNKSNGALPIDADLLPGDPEIPGSWFWPNR